jgi:cardiolipin synthase
VLKHLPNLLSFLRLAAAPLAAWLILQAHDTAALLLFAAAGLSDGLDGFIARRWQATSRIGAWLDPIADKLLMLLCLLALWQIGVTPWWLLALVVLRDLCIALGLALGYFLALPLMMQASFLGKTATVVHIIYIGGCLLLLAFDVEAPRLLFAAAFAAAVFALVSWVGYGTALARALRAGRA